MPTDPVITVLAALILACWAALGLFVHVNLRDDAREWPLFGRAWLIALCGPVVWVSTIHAALGRLRRSILRRFGVEGYTCCGGHDDACDHNPPANGQRNDRANPRRVHGYPADAIANHPGGHL